MHIGALVAEGCQRIKALTIDLQGRSIVIGGPNMAGKTSLINTIPQLVLGKKAMPADPVNHDCLKGHIVGTVLDDEGNEHMTIERTFDKAGNGSVKVTYADGRTSTSQTLLNDFWNVLGPDLGTFILSDDATRAKILREMSGIDFSKFDAEHKQAYDERTGIGRLRDQAKKVHESAPYDPSLPDTPPNADEMLKKHADGRETWGTYERLKMEIVRLNPQSLVDKEAELERQLALVREQMADMRKKAETLYADVIAMEPNLPDMAMLDAEFASIQSTSNAILTNQTAKKALTDYQNAAQLYDAKTDLLAKIASDRLEAQKKAMPISTMTLDDGVVLVDGVPFLQLSDSQKIRVALAVFKARQPDLAVCIIRNASMFDEATLTEVLTDAEFEGMQIIAELSRGTEQASIIIEDGEIVEDRR